MEISAQKKKMAAFQRKMTIAQSIKSRQKQLPTTNHAVSFDIIKVDTDKHKDDLREKFNESIGQFEDVWGGCMPSNQVNRSQPTNVPISQSNDLTITNQNANSSNISAQYNKSGNQSTFSNEIPQQSKKEHQQEEQQIKVNQQKSSNMHHHKRLSDQRTLTPDQPKHFSHHSLSQQSTPSNIIKKTPMYDISSKSMQIAKFKNYESSKLLEVIDKMLKDLRPSSMLSPLSASCHQQNHSDVCEEKDLDPTDPSYNEELFGKFESDDDEDEEEEEGEIGDSSSSSSSSSSESESESIGKGIEDEIPKKSEVKYEDEDDEDDGNSWSLSSIMKQIKDSKPCLPKKHSNIPKTISPASTFVSQPDYPQFSIPSSPLQHASHAPNLHSPYQSSVHSIASSFHTHLQSENSRDVTSPHSASSPFCKDPTIDAFAIPLAENQESDGEIDSSYYSRQTPIESPIKMKSSKSMKQVKKRKACDENYLQQSATPLFEIETKKTKYETDASIPCKLTESSEQSDKKEKRKKEEKNELIMSAKKEIKNKNLLKEVKAPSKVDSFFSEEKQSFKDNSGYSNENKISNSISINQSKTSMQPSFLPLHHDMPAIELVFTQQEVKDLEKMTKKRMGSFENNQQLKMAKKVTKKGDKHNSNVSNSNFPDSESDFNISKIASNVNMNSKEEFNNFFNNKKLSSSPNKSINEDSKNELDKLYNPKNSTKANKEHSGKIDEKEEKTKELKSSSVKNVIKKKKSIDNISSKINKKSQEKIKHKEGVKTLSPETQSMHASKKSIKNKSYPSSNDTPKYNNDSSNITTHGTNRDNEKIKPIENVSNTPTKITSTPDKKFSEKKTPDLNNAKINLETNKTSNNNNDSMKMDSKNTVIENNITMNNKNTKVGLIKRVKKTKTSHEASNIQTNNDNSQEKNATSSNNIVESSKVISNNNNNEDRSENIRIGLDVKKKQEVDRLSDHARYREFIKKSPQDVYETAKKLLVQAGSMQNNNPVDASTYDNLLTYTEATSFYLAHFLMTNCRNISTIEYLFKSLQTIDQQMARLGRCFEVTRLKVLLLRLKALVNLHAYNIRVGQKGTENFKAVVDKLRTANEEPSPKQSPDSSTNMTSDAKKGDSQSATSSMILGMDLKELNEYAYTTTFLQLSHQCFDESNRRSRADPECKSFYSKLEKRFGVFHFYLHYVNLMVYVQGAVQALKCDVKKLNGKQLDVGKGVSNLEVKDNCKKNRNQSVYRCNSAANAADFNQIATK